MQKGPIFFGPFFLFKELKNENRPNKITTKRQNGPKCSEKGNMAQIELGHFAHFDLGHFSLGDFSVTQKNIIT